MKKAYNIENNHLVETHLDESILDIYIEPTTEQINSIIAEYCIDQHNLYSSLDPDEIGRVEIEDDFTFILLKRPKNYSSKEQLFFKVTTVGIFVNKAKIIIVMPEDIQILEGKQSYRISNGIDILLKLIYGTVFHFLGHLKVINMIIDNLETEIHKNMKIADLIKLYSLKKSLVYYTNAIGSNKVVLDKIKDMSKKFHFSEQNIDFLDDILIENNQCALLTETYSKVIDILIKSRDSLANKHLNNVMKRLTLITTIFMPLTLISGIGGMSEWSYVFGPDNWYYSFPICFLIMGAISFLTYKIFKWNGWT